MGQITIPSRQDIILTATDRLVARNSDGGLAAGAQHVILFGEVAGLNDSLNNIIAIGAFALDAGLADTDIEGTIAIGVNAASSVTAGTNNADVNAANVIIGQRAAEQAAFLDSMVVIGGEALSDYVGLVTTGADRSVVIGNEAVQNLNGSAQFSGNTAIGWRAMRCSAGAFNMTNNVVIGSTSCNGIAATFNNNTVVGSGSGIIMGNSGNLSDSNTILGASAGNNLDVGDENVLIGAGTNLTNAGAQHQNVVVGRSASAYGSQNTVLGFGANNGVAGAAGLRNIVIGYQGGATLPNGRSDTFVVETFDGGINRAILYADLATGNLIVGGSNQGVDRDFDGAATRNILKLLNGVPGGLAPVGGGYFYVAAGLLHFVTSTGVDRALTPAGQLASQTGAAYTNNAAANAGTLLNAPTAGDPTKWIPINDNGTIRNIPAW